MRLRFVPIHVFRETPAVTFFDASVEASNGTPVTSYFFAEATADTVSSITRHRVEKLLPIATFLLQCRHLLQGNGNVCGYIATQVLPLWTSAAERRFIATLADARQ